MAQTPANQTAHGTDLGTAERLVHIAQIREGDESKVRQLVQERFPAQAFEQTGVQSVTMFVGSTYLISEYEFTTEYTPTFTTLRSDPTINGFIEQLGRLLDDEPMPVPDAPAMQFLASQALRWQRGHGTEHTPRVRPKSASTDRV
jgi:hypothetical protein